MSTLNSVSAELELEESQGERASRLAFVFMVSTWFAAAAVVVVTTLLTKGTHETAAGIVTVVTLVGVALATALILRSYGSTNYFSRAVSRLMWGLAVLFTIVIISLLCVITGYLVSIGAREISLAFFTKEPIPIGMEGHPGGMVNGLVGSAVMITLASVIGIPVGMLTGVYLSEYEAESILAAPVRFVADVLAGVPSIVVGILGYELLVVPFANGTIFGMPVPFMQHLFGIRSHNGWAGAFALAFIMIPIVARTTEEMLRLVPGSYREAAIALGATKARTILGVVIPSATGSVVTGIMLAIARVAGETAPLLWTASMARSLTFNPNEKFPSLTVQIFLSMTSHERAQQRQAWAGILVLITLIFLLNIAIRLTVRPRRRA